MDIWLEVKILPRLDILDVEGRAILESLKQSETNLKDCRFGKVLRLLITAEDEKTAKKKAKRMIEAALNPLIETCEINAVSSHGKDDAAKL